MQMFIDGVHEAFIQSGFEFENIMTVILLFGN